MAKATSTWGAWGLGGWDWPPKEKTMAATKAKKKAKTKTKRRKRRIQGKDWHGWAWECGDDDMKGQLFWWAEPDKPPPSERPTSKGKWVRVLFKKV